MEQKKWTRSRHEPAMVGTKICKSCPGKGPQHITRFAIHRNSPDGRRTICKKCLSYNASCKQIINNAEKNPDKYRMCNGCDRVFSKFKDGGHYTHMKRPVRDDCKFCGSKDIEKY